MTQKIAQLEKQLKSVKDEPKKLKLLEELSRLHVSQENFKSAYEFYQKAVDVKEKILNRETQKQITELETRYKTEQKEREKEIYRLRNVDLKKALKELKANQDQLVKQEKMATLGQLTAGVAHEIQNPLNFINNFSEVNTELLTEWIEEISVDDSLSEDEKKEEFEQMKKDIQANTDKIEHHIDRAADIIEQMKMHIPGKQSRKAMADINKLVKDASTLAYQSFLSRHEEFSAHFNFNFDDTIGKTKINRLKFSSVIFNMVGNSLYALHEAKTTSGQIDISSTLQKEKIEIRIRDNGPGIPNEIVDKVFNPFFTTKPTGHGNTGLGLSLSYDVIVKGHGGELKVETKEGKFTEFLIKIPSK